jgi:hypothetical protein
MVLFPRYQVIGSRMSAREATRFMAALSDSLRQLKHAQLVWPRFVRRAEDVTLLPAHAIFGLQYVRAIDLTHKLPAAGDTQRRTLHARFSLLNPACPDALAEGNGYDSVIIVSTVVSPMYREVVENLVALCENAAPYMGQKWDQNVNRMAYDAIVVCATIEQ